MPISDPEDYYDENDESEWDRLTATLLGQLESSETVAQRDANLPDTGHVLDVGGGAGRYAVGRPNRDTMSRLSTPARAASFAQENAEHGSKSGWPSRRATCATSGLPGRTTRRDLGGPLTHDASLTNGQPPCGSCTG